MSDGDTTSLQHKAPTGTLMDELERWWKAPALMPIGEGPRLMPIDEGVRLRDEITTALEAGDEPE